MNDPIICPKCGRKYRYDYCLAKLQPLPARVHPGPCAYCGGGVPEPLAPSMCDPHNDPSSMLEGGAA